jgi:hypothetical protein
MRWLVGVFVLAGCGAAHAPAPPAEPVENRAPEEPREESPLAAPPAQYDPPPAAWVGNPMPALPPVECATGITRVDALDLDSDGKTDVQKLYSQDLFFTEWLRCKLVDFDHDGRFDAGMFYGVGNVLQLEVFDLDFDGRVDMANRIDPATGKMTTIRDLDIDGSIDP